MKKVGCSKKVIRGIVAPKSGPATSHIRRRLKGLLFATSQQFKSREGIFLTCATVQLDEPWFINDNVKIQGQSLQHNYRVGRILTFHGCGLKGDLLIYCTTTLPRQLQLHFSFCIMDHLYHFMTASSARIMEYIEKTLIHVLAVGVLTVKTGRRE